MNVNPNYVDNDDIHGRALPILWLLILAFEAHARSTGAWVTCTVWSACSIELAQIQSGAIDAAFV